MKFMLMMNGPRNSYQTFGSWPEKDIRNHIAFMRRFAEKLTKQGELVSCEGLTSPEQAKRVRAGKDGKPITDGVFPETKEYLAGYWIVEAPTLERAIEIAAEASAAPGKDGAPLNMDIELREVAGGPPLDA